MTGATVLGKQHIVPTLYDGPDLEFVSRALGLGIKDVVHIHASTLYHVQAIGFLPGFPYAGDLPEKLRGLARRSSPRTRVEAGSVAIVGTQTAIYPMDSPGGWHIIGRTPLVVASIELERFPIEVGDQLNFEPIDEKQFKGLLGTPL